jgi:signal transduction histidine kinase
MRNSLFFKLLGAFLLVIIVGSLIISLLVSRATGRAFNIYATRNGLIWGQELAPSLANYYTQTGSWQGVDELLQSLMILSHMPAGPSNMMGQGRLSGQGPQNESNIMTMVEQRSILVDAQRWVISDSLGELAGKQLPESELKKGTPILANGVQVGTIIITPVDQARSNSSSGVFLRAVNRAIIGSTILAVLIAIVIGASLFLSITSPLRQLSKAATAISHGDLNQRVDIRSKDELGELGLTFNKMAESLSNAEIQRQALMADVAHELRTPLTAIQGTLEGIQDGVLPLEEEQISVLLAETTLLNRLIGDLRLLSMAETGHLKLELREIDLGELLLQINEQVRPQAEQKGIRMEVDVQPGLPKIAVDPDRISQIINNLISNALRFTPKSGTILVKVSSPTHSNDLQVSISDTGSGIEPEDLPFVFDRFYRADKSRARSSGGSGLGLAIVKQLVEAHGGQVRVESPIYLDKDNQGFGTRFTFTLYKAA